MDTDTKVFDKIRALIRKAESSEHEGEAEAFADAAARIALKNAIDLSTLGDSQGADDFGTFKYEMHMPYRKDKLGMLNGMLAVVGAYLYYSNMRGTGKGGYFRVTIIGRKRVVESVWITFNSLCIQLDTAMLSYVDPASAAAAENPEHWADHKGYLGTQKKKYRRSFAVGFTGSVIDRWQKMKRTMEDEIPGSGLVLLSDYQRAKDAVTVSLGKRSRSSIREGRAGAQAGNMADIGGTRLPTGPAAICSGV